MDNELLVFKELYELRDLTKQINMLNDLYNEDIVSRKQYDMIYMNCMKQHNERLGLTSTTI